MPKLSIVVPVYNVEKYLNQCIDSILAQTFADFELILVDDGSTDQSGSICDEYAKTDPRVTVIHTKNQGVVTARKTGVNCSNGEYVAFVDSDDWLDLDFYRCIFEKSGEKKADILICNRFERASGCAATTLFGSGYYGRDKLESTVFPQLMYDIYTEKYQISPSIWGKLFKTELLKEVYEGVDPCVTLGEDAVCTFPYITRANSLYIIENEACYHYREDHISMVNNCDIRLLQRVTVLAENITQQLSDVPMVFDDQIATFVAYNGLFAAFQVLIYNRELSLIKRVEAVKEFFEQPIMANAFGKTLAMPCSTKFKWKSYFAFKNHPFPLFLLYKIAAIIRKIKP